MSDRIETVNIVNEDSPCGYVVINKCDMSEDDVVFGEKSNEDKGLNAPDMIEAINGCESIEELEGVFVEGEGRQGVLKAFNRKMDSLVKGK